MSADLARRHGLLGLLVSPLKAAIPREFPPDLARLWHGCAVVRLAGSSRRPSVCMLWRGRPTAVLHVVPWSPEALLGGDGFCGCCTSPLYGPDQGDLGLRPCHTDRVSNDFGGGQGPGLNLNNSATDVFLDVLMLAASDLAHTPWELRFTSWLALHAQELTGRGFAGFELDEADWGKASEHQARQIFVLRVIDSARGGHRWDELGYEPVNCPGFDGDIEDPEGSRSWLLPVSTLMNCASARRGWRSRPVRTPLPAPAPMKRIADQLDVHPEALRTWVKRAETDADARPGTTGQDANRIAELEREVKELRRANAILKSASAFFAAELDRPLR